MSSKIFCVVLLSLLGLAASVNVITNIPGYDGPLPFAAYSGYLPANDGNKQMFYFFSESQGNPSTDPVVLWLNGGPGCSSFDGFVYEHGPFFFNNGPMGAQQNLTLNPYSWTKVANMIYLDSPCGVGLSYSTNPNDYNTNDKVTARDSHNFLLNFFTAFPQFKNNDFYVAGESYAGIYVPTLAQQIVEGNNVPATYINLKGILVGNGVTDAAFDTNAFLPFVYGHSFISDGLYDDIYTACGGLDIYNATGALCNELLQNASSDVSALNIYNVYMDCYMGNNEVDTELFDVFHRVSSRLRDMHTPSVEGQVPCIDSSRAAAWLNLDSVRTALNAIPVSQQEWEICSDLINYTTIYSTVIPIHKYLLSSGVRIMIYSGDVDMCVPNTGTEAWTDSLNLPLIDEWRAWMVNNQVAGYVREYKGLTYATIKGAGHMVPQFKPPQALHFFTNFLNQQPL